MKKKPDKKLENKIISAVNIAVKKIHGKKIRLNSKNRTLVNGNLEYANTVVNI